MITKTIERQPLFQGLVDAAYNRWQAANKAAGGGWTKDEFWAQLNVLERPAVFLGNMNAQVLNGGFNQWWDNQYATDETVADILRYLHQIGTENAKAISELVEKFWGLVPEGSPHRAFDGDEEAHDYFQSEVDELCTAYYAIDNDKFLDEVEAWLTGQRAAVCG